MTRSAPDANSASIVTLTTDFGVRDFYVAAMKAVLLNHRPTARLIDITHGVPRHDILFGAIMLERAVASFPAGTVHLCVVDPGVGTDRRLLLARTGDQWIVCPDNGLITWTWRRRGEGQAHELIWRPERFSQTFHGRDIMAPAAAMLAGGRPLGDLAAPIDDPVLLNLFPITTIPCRASVIHIDAFGNAATNLVVDSPAAGAALASASVRVKDVDLGAPRAAYGDVAPGQPLALIGSSGLLEIAVREGSAADALGLVVGDEIIVTT